MRLVFLLFWSTCLGFNFREMAKESFLTPSTHSLPLHQAQPYLNGMSSAPAQQITNPSSSAPPPSRPGPPPPLCSDCRPMRPIPNNFPGSGLSSVLQGVLLLYHLIK